MLVARLDVRDKKREEVRSGGGRGGKGPVAMPRRRGARVDASWGGGGGEGVAWVGMGEWRHAHTPSTFARHPSVV